MASVKSGKRPAQDEDGIAPDAKRLKPSASPPPDDYVINHDAFPKKPAVIEEENGEISFQVVNNDGKPNSHIVLTGLKCIFQKQLPKMPKDYIARLVYDRTHLSIAIVKKPPPGSFAETSNLPGEVVGGITYRPFKGRQFAEIVFCAISSDQQVSPQRLEIEAGASCTASCSMLNSSCRLNVYCSFSMADSFCFVGQRLWRAPHEPPQRLRQVDQRRDAFPHLCRQLRYRLL